MENRRSPFIKILSLTLSVLMIMLSADVGFAVDQTKEEAPAKAVEVAAPAATPEAVSPAQAMPSAQVTAEIASVDEEVVPATPVDPGNVTVNFKQADIRTVLSYIADVSGVDIVAAPEVKGVIDLKLTNKPWMRALELITKNYGLAYEREGDIIRVITVDKLQQEELVTQAFKLNYGSAKKVIESVRQLLSDKRGRVTYDERTNTAVVTDIPTKLYKIGEMINSLDKKTSQVLIEARIIETRLTDEEKLGIDWNIKITASGSKRPTTVPFDYFNTTIGPLDKFMPLVQTGASTLTVSPGGQTTTVPPGMFPTGASGAATATNAKGFPFADFTQTQFQDAFKFGTLDFSEFQAVLEMLKKRADTDSVANPRIATLNNIKAKIDVGENIPMPTFERSSVTGKMEITGYTTSEFFSGTVLEVTPHINDKSEIIMDLNPTITSIVEWKTITPELQVPIMATRKASTQIMIKDGDTIFIGGLIREVDIVTNKKVPFIGDALGDVPYLGLLFSRKEKAKERRELIFFITVHIMEPGKVIQSSPLSEKAYNPQFTATQKVGAPPKKKNKWFWQK